MNDFCKQPETASGAFWAPFTPMRQFQQQPMMFTSAEGMYYTTSDGRRVLDAMAGLWCVNAGHGQANRAGMAVWRCAKGGGAAAKACDSAFHPLL